MALKNFLSSMITVSSPFAPEGKRLFTDGNPRPGVEIRLTDEGEILSRGPDSDLKRWGQKLAERGGRNARKRAVVAVARKLGVLLHRLWVTGEVYEPLRNSGNGSEAAAAA